MLLAQLARRMVRGRWWLQRMTFLGRLVSSRTSMVPPVLPPDGSAEQFIRTVPQLKSRERFFVYVSLWMSPLAMLA